MVNKMNVFTLSETLLNAKYKGAGHALAASVNGEIIHLVYLRDVFEDFDVEEKPLKDWISDERITPTMRELSALGDVHVGMCSASEFCEL